MICKGASPTPPAPAHHLSSRGKKGDNATPSDWDDGGERASERRSVNSISEYPSDLACLPSASGSPTMDVGWSPVDLGARGWRMRRKLALHAPVRSVQSGRVPRAFSCEHGN
ncbi:unnamed protein product [Lampetra planeri]